MMSDNKQKLILHIGLHKTGTSYLQEHVFTKMDEVTAIRGWQSFRYLMLFKLKNHCLITDEGISGNLISGTWEQDFFDNLTRVKTLFGNPKIIVGFRQAHKFIPSAYKQYLHSGGFDDFSDFFNFENTGLIKQEELQFRKRIDFLKENFSEVFFYTQESLKERPQDFLDAVCEFMNVERLDNSTLSTTVQNKSMRTNAQVNFLKTANRFNKQLNKLPFKPSLYNKYFKKLKITPVHINLNMVKNIKSPTFKPDDALISQMKDFYQEDWAYTLEHLSY